MPKDRKKSIKEWQTDLLYLSIYYITKNRFFKNKLNDILN